jgi:cell wall-associated NlpC family hydrolase
VDGIAAVQSRIAQIESFNPASSATSWMNAGNAATSAPSSSASFADALAKAQQTAQTQRTNRTGQTGTAGRTAEQEVVAEARKYLGIPYVWGGTNPDVGLDCSGLTQLVYKNLGYDIPRVSYEQATAGRRVDSLADARPGDLVFYDYSSSRDGIDHVGIYIGDGRMIAAPKAGEAVKIQDAGTPAVIRRVLPEQPVPTATGGPAALAKTESGFNPSAVSSAGALGLMQFMPATAAGLGVDPLKPSSAVNGAAKYLAQHLRDFGSIDLALAAYNAGPGAVRQYGGIPPYEETQNYVTKVRSAWEGYR